MRAVKSLCARLGVALFFLLFWAASPAVGESLLVVPFENTARVADLDWVGESFAVTLSRHLAGPGRVVVTREERLAALERLGLPPTAPLSHASLVRLGEEAEVDWVLWGRFQVEDGQLSAVAHWLVLPSLELSPGMEETGSFPQLLELQGRLARRVLNHLEPGLPPLTRESEQEFSPLQVSAFESYVRGLLALHDAQRRRYFLQAVRLQPDYARAAFRLGQLFFEDEDYATAGRWFAQVAPESDLGPDARFYLALCHFFAHDFAQSLETLAPLAHDLPVKPVWNNLGIFASRQAEPAAAGYFARALEIDPADADIHFNRGLHHLRREEWEQAVRFLEGAVELNPGDTEAYFLLAHALERLGRTPEAERARQQAVGDNPALALSLERRQLQLDRLEQHFSAHQARLELARRPAPAAPSPRARHVAIHLARGEDLLARGQLEPAQRELAEAILLDPNSFRAHSSLAELYERQGRVDAAISELKAALWIEDTVSTRLRLAELYLSRERFAEAREHVRAALALEPDHAAARALAARLPAQAAESRLEDGEEE